MQVYVNVKVMNDTGIHRHGTDPVGAGSPANAISQAMTVTLLTHSRVNPLPQGRRYAGKPGVVHHLYVNVNLASFTVNPLITFT